MRGARGESTRPLRILMCNWRDTRNPEGGGAERYVETMAKGLAERGHRVTIACAAHAQAPRDENADGVRIIRRGSKLSVYGHTFVRLALRRYGPVDVVVDVQNGLPFFTRLATRCRVVVLVHHVHREQWPVVYPGLIGRIGWWIERRLAPRLYRCDSYITVSEATRAELVSLGIEPDRITVIHNGSDPAPPTAAAPSATPRIIVLGRLVPHKQVEHAIDALGALVADHPEAHLDLVGDGWWRDQLLSYASAHSLSDHVTFHGFVDEQTKHQLLARSWVMLLPSLKEGWGIVVGEAGTHGVPCIAYRSAGGTRESIHDGVSGLLVDSPAELTGALRHVIEDAEDRARLGAAAFAMARRFSWANSVERFSSTIEAVAGRPGAANQLLP